MRSLLTHLLLVTVIFSVTSQKKYHLPNGISEKDLDPDWIIAKVKVDGSDFENLGNEVHILHKREKGKPSILDGVCKVRVEGGQDPVQLINQLLHDPNVIYAEPMLKYEPLYLPSDPSNESNQSYLEQISAYDAWDITRGDDDIVIGISDTGIDLDHADLQASIWENTADPIDNLDNDGNGFIDDFYGYDFEDDDNDPSSDGNEHGTRVAGIAGASTDNSIGISGVGFNSKIAALKGIRFEAIIYAADMSMEVLNLSWGSARAPLQSEQDIIDYAVLEKDVVIAVSAGNDGAQAEPEALFYPASYKNVLSVGAVDANDNRWTNSTYNYFVDIMAPGASLYSTINNDGYGTQSGTSFSSPIVAGVAALVRAEFPDLTARQVMERVRISADDIYDIGTNSFFEGKLGHGRVNAFNAVSQTNLKSVRVTDFEAQTAFSNNLFFGDTVTFNLEQTNFLSPTEELQITISSPEDNFSIAENVVHLPALNTLEVGNSTFDIVLSDNLEPETPIVLRLDLMEGAYTDYQFIQTATSPDHIDFGSDLKMTIAGNGNLGFADQFFSHGSGILHNGNTILTYAGLIVAQSEMSVSDNVISDYATQSREQNFNSKKNYKLLHHPVANLFGYSEFEDPINNLIIEQSNYSWIGDDYILLRYRLVNNSDTQLDNLSIGLFADFDLDDPLKNEAAFDGSGEYVFTKNLAETLFSGVKVISTGTPRYSVLDVDNQNGNDFDVETTFDDASKYDFLVNQQLAAAGTNGDGNDVAMLIGTTIAQLGAFDSEFFNVIVAAGPTQSGLEAQFANAENQLSQIVSNPRILESVVSCEGSQVKINPQAGEVYQFFQDPEGLVQLQEGTEFTTGTIDQDTAFYVKNMDAAYASDIFQIPVRLIEEVANFRIEPDTLYLDNSTNVVSFIDESFQPMTWNWDFGQGTTSTIQNPMLSFNQAGQYEISLTVENEAGCLDTTVKTLVVAERPDSPVFTTFNICPGDLVTLSDPSADFLKVFSNEQDLNPTHQGNDLEVGPFSGNTTIFVSGIYNQFESLKTPVEIVVEQFSTNFTIEIDTTSVAHQIIVRPPLDAESLEWFVNDVSQGTENEIVLDSAELQVNIRLDQTNENDCTVSEEKTFTFSSSSIPSQQDVIFCENGFSLLQPQNGEIFGFYRDVELTDLIKKGTELLVTESMQIFVVGLDDGLPSEPIEVNVTFEEFELEIVSTSQKIGEKNRISLSTNPSEGISQFEWYIDGDLVETSAKPTFTLNDDLYEIVAKITNDNGCIHSDTLQLDLIPPLGVQIANLFIIYPNPSDGHVVLLSQSNSKVNDLSLWNLSGSLITKLQFASSLDLSFLNPGIYILKLETEGSIYERRLIVRPD